MSFFPPEPGKPGALTCDTGSIRLYAADLRAASAQLDDFGGFCRSEAKLDAWVGDDSVAYHDGLPEEGTRADALSLGLRRVSQRVEVHADRLDALETRRDDLVERQTMLGARCLWLQERHHKLGVELVELEDDASTLRRDISDYRTDVTTWEADVAAEEQAMLRVFTRHQDDTAVFLRYAGQEDPADAALDRKPENGTPEQNRAWWDSLSRTEQLAIIAASPGSIGNLDGIPAWARSDANETALERDIAALEQRVAEGEDLSGDEEDWLRNAKAARDGLEEVRSRVDPVTGEPVVGQLYIYDPTWKDGDGRVGISAGDLDTADDVSVLVPGFSNDASAAASGADRVGNLYEAARYEDPSRTSASLFWMGYDAPDDLDSGGVLLEHMAAKGGEELADAIDGLRASRDDEAHMTVIGHSYGSTTVGHGATDHGLDVDEIALMGSPGPGDDAEHARDLGIGEGNVYVGSSSRDLITALGDKGLVNLGNVEGGLGHDPADKGWGGTRFRAEDVDRNDHVRNLTDHSRYFDHDTESLSNLAKVITGHGDDVSVAEDRHDPWYGGWEDPEWDRDPDAVRTRPEG